MNEKRAHMDHKGDSMDETGGRVAGRCGESVNSVPKLGETRSGGRSWSHRTSSLCLSDGAKVPPLLVVGHIELSPPARRTKTRIGSVQDVSES